MNGFRPEPIRSEQSRSEKLARVTFLPGAQETLVRALAENAEPSDPAAGAFEPISNVSMHALGRRGVSSRELAKHLQQRGFDSHAIEEEVARLEGVGLLDDRELAQTLVRRLRERKALGNSALLGELKRRQLDSSAIDDALGISDGDDENARALALAVRRAPQLLKLDAATAKRRLNAYLARRGYGSSTVNYVVDAVLKGER